MCRLSFYAVTIGDVLNSMKDRLDSFRILLDQGFSNTIMADRYCVLDLRVEIIDGKKISQYSEKNLYWVDVPFDLTRAIYVLEIKINQLKDNMSSPFIFTSKYVENIRNQVLKTSLIDEMKTLLDKAKAEKELNNQRVTIDIPTINPTTV